MVLMKLNDVTDEVWCSLEFPWTLFDEIWFVYNIVWREFEVVVEEMWNEKGEEFGVTLMLQNIPEIYSRDILTLPYIWVRPEIYLRKQKVFVKSYMIR